MAITTTLGIDVDMISKNANKSEEKMAKALKKLNITDAIGSVIDKDTLADKIKSAINNNCFVYYTKKKKELCGVWIFEKKTRSTADFKDDPEFEKIEDFKDKTEISVLEFKESIYNSDVKDKLSEVESDVKEIVSDTLSYSETEVVVWGDDLILEDESSDNGVYLLFGVAIGITLGNLIFDDMMIGIVVGIVLAPLFSFGVSKAKVIKFKK